jgi:hypothetical protein
VSAGGNCKGTLMAAIPFRRTVMQRPCCSDFQDWYLGDSSQLRRKMLTIFQLQCMRCCELKQKMNWDIVIAELTLQGPDGCRLFEKTSDTLSSITLTGRTHLMGRIPLYIQSLPSIGTTMGLTWVTITLNQRQRASVQDRASMVLFASTS